MLKWIKGMDSDAMVMLLLVLSRAFVLHKNRHSNSHNNNNNTALSCFHSLVRFLFVIPLSLSHRIVSTGLIAIVNGPSAVRFFLWNRRILISFGWHSPATATRGRRRQDTLTRGTVGCSFLGFAAATQGAYAMDNAHNDINNKSAHDDIWNGKLLLMTRERINSMEF